MNVLVFLLGVLGFALVDLGWVLGWDDCWDKCCGCRCMVVHRGNGQCRGDEEWDVAEIVSHSKR